MPVNHQEFDLSHPNDIKNYLSSLSLAGIIHCAAWTNVNLAEEQTNDCITVNAESTKVLADYCQEKNIPLMFISTDYVFDGTKNNPYSVDDETNPLNIYGLSKKIGEEYVSKIEKHYIVRTSWIFGKNKHDFVKMIIEQSKTNDSIGVSCNQIGSPTYSFDLVPLLYKIFTSGKYGTYHAHNEGYCSRADFAKEIVRLVGSKTKIVDVTTDNNKSSIKRPINARLETSKLSINGFPLLPPWQDALKRYLNSISEIE